LDMKACMECWMTSRVSARHADTLSWLIIWRPLFFWLFWPRKVLESLFEGPSPLHSTAGRQSFRFSVKNFSRPALAGGPENNFFHLGPLSVEQGITSDFCKNQ
jgi:hypothetical protein